MELPERFWQKWLVKCYPPLLGLAPLQLYLLLPTFLDNERYNIPSFIEKKNRKQQQKTKRLIALEINNKKWNLPTPLPLPSRKKYLLNSSSLAIYKAKKKLQPPLQPTSLNIPSHGNIATAKKNTIRKLISIIQQKLQKSWLNFGTDQIICDNNNKQF